ncbi:helix-turn-helix domain-containing protein [Saccharothrix longispora]|uniref:Transcriptional regulator with XRE-family HTH domain n=1 Tax=Saccharothrix longispora TaxID=33920 RepID=A0ABU1PR38_9PSEU|nr:helix-turn-helix transcriptional regulator [Saccharothrix longispora]MDR6592379.1 transcriptional regulator with XRE-family HTH domain [Saccharothrix longispora]
MPDTAGGIGRRVRYWRLRRNLGRKQFADMIGRSTSWLDKVESGERDLVRLPVIELVADALAVDPGVLTDARAAARAADCVDAAEVGAIRAALGRYPGLATADTRPADVAHLARQADYVDHAWTSSHFTTVARRLPELLGAAQRAVLAAPPAEQVDAHRILVTSYRLASSMLLKFESHDVAWLAADRAMHTALAVDDTWSQARATRSVARAMTATGQRAEAVEILLGTSDRMRREVAGRPASLLSLHGMLHLAAAITAAEREDASWPCPCTRRPPGPPSAWSATTTPTTPTSAAPTSPSTASPPSSACTRPERHWTSPRPSATTPSPGCRRNAAPTSCST